MSAELMAGLLKSECHFKEGMTAEDILHESFRKAKNHWMITNEDHQFLGACAAAYAAMNEPDKERLKASLDNMKVLKAILDGVPVDLDAALARMESVKGFPLQSMWQEGAKP